MLSLILEIVGVLIALGIIAGLYLYAPPRKSRAEEKEDAERWREIQRAIDAERR